MAKPALGRGLGALLGGSPPNSKTAPLADRDSSATLAEPNAPVGEQVQRIPLGEIRPCPLQPRQDFSAESLQELADSIREQGILQPLIVRRQNDHYELIAGERRWRAAQMLELDKVPVIVRLANDQEVLELALIENLQRENLNSLEEALGYRQLMRQFELRQEDVAVKVGKSRAVVANALRLLKLPDDVQQLIRENRLSVGHAKVILGLDSPQEQTIAAECVLKDGLNVRQTEEMVSLFQNKIEPPASAGSASADAPPRPAARDAHTLHLENRLQERFGTKVRLQYRKGKGSIQIRFFNDDDLSRILQLTGVEVD